MMVQALFPVRFTRYIVRPTYAAARLKENRVAFHELRFAVSGIPRDLIFRAPRGLRCQRLLHLLPIDANPR